MNQRTINDIHVLTNTGQEMKTKLLKDDVFYLIHKIIENGDSEKYRKNITEYKLIGKKDIFMKVLTN